MILFQVFWFVGANVSGGVIIEGWLTKHIALRHGCGREEKWINGVKNTENPSTGWREGNLKASVYMIFFFYMAAFHSKLDDFPFLLCIMNSIQTVFFHKQERLTVQPVVKICQQIICLVYANWELTLKFYPFFIWLLKFYWTTCKMLFSPIPNPETKAQSVFQGFKQVGRQMGATIGGRNSTDLRYSKW